MKNTARLVIFGTAFLASACSEGQQKNVVVEGPPISSDGYDYYDTFYLSSEEFTLEIKDRLESENCVREEEVRRIVYKCPGDVLWLGYLPR